MHKSVLLKIWSQVLYLEGKEIIALLKSVEEGQFTKYGW